MTTDADPVPPVGTSKEGGSAFFPIWGGVAAAFVLLAIVLEVIGGTAANSVVPEWAYKVAPLAWPQPVRVVWWVLVAVAAALYRLAERRAGIRRSIITLVVSVAPFLIFAGGIAFGAGWATWH